MYRIASYLAEPSLRGLIMQNLARTQHHQNQRICTHIVRTKSYQHSPIEKVDHDFCGGWMQAGCLDDLGHGPYEGNKGSNE